MAIDPRRFRVSSSRAAWPSVPRGSRGLGCRELHLLDGGPALSCSSSTARRLYDSRTPTAAPHSIRDRGRRRGRSRTD